jgi:hypothetical protein
VAQDDELFEDASQNDKKAIQASSAIIIPFPKLR